MAGGGPLRRGRRHQRERGRALALRKRLSRLERHAALAGGGHGRFGLRRLRAPDEQAGAAVGPSRLTGAGAGSVARPGAPVYVRCAVCDMVFFFFFETVKHVDTGSNNLSSSFAASSYR